MGIHSSQCCFFGKWTPHTRASFFCRNLPRVPADTTPNPPSLFSLYFRQIRLTITLSSQLQISEAKLDVPGFIIHVFTTFKPIPGTKRSKLQASKRLNTYASCMTFSQFQAVRPPHHSAKRVRLFHHTLNISEPRVNTCPGTRFCFHHTKHKSPTTTKNDLCRTSNRYARIGNYSHPFCFASWRDSPICLLVPVQRTKCTRDGSRKERWRGVHSMLSHVVDTPTI